ncbi:MAG: hypothetical protein R3Y12_06930 [Clostridia bacterium]
MKTSKTLAMLLASSMILATLSACGSTDSTTNTGNSNNNTNTNVAEDVDLNLSGTSPITFPLDEPLTFDFHYHNSDKYVFDETWPVFEYMAELTNISLVNVANPVSTSTTTELSLQAFDQFPADLYGGGGNNSDYFREYGPLGAFYSLDDYMEYLPNYSAYLAENKDVIASTVSSDGKMYYIPILYNAPLTRVLFIRQDWLDNLGLEMPTTTEEYEQVLIAFRDDDPNGNGLNDEIPFFCDYWNEMIRLVTLWDARAYGSSDMTTRITMNDDGEMYHTWMTDEFKTGIENISRWYDMGLIDREIFTKGTASRKEYIPGDVGGSTRDMIASTSSYHDTVDIDGFHFAVMAPPVTATGNQFEENGRANVGTNGWAISTSCPEEYVGALFTYMDYFWSEEGWIMSNFGIEDVDYTMQNGEPIFTDAVLNNPDNKAVNTYLREDVGAQVNIGYLQDFRYELQWTHETGVTGIDMYLAEGYHEVFRMPSLSFEGDDLTNKLSLTSEINAFLDEKIQTFIVSDWTLIDGQWDSYITQLENMGVQDLVDIYTTAYANFAQYLN